MKTNSFVRVDVVSIYYYRGLLGMWQLLPLVWSVQVQVQVKSSELTYVLSGITSDNSDSDSTPELLEHDRKGAALAVCIDELRYSQPMVSGRCFARQASDDLLIEVPSPMQSL